MQRCTVHKERNLLAHAPEGVARRGQGRLHRHDVRRNAEQVRKKRKAFLAKCGSAAGAWRTAWEEAGSGCFLPALSAAAMEVLRTTNAIERLHGEFKRRVKTQWRTTQRGNGGHAVLGLDGLGADHHAAGRGWQTLDQGRSRSRLTSAAD